jgi:N-acetylglucosamine kinase-like BadF-type ATPase
MRPVSAQPAVMAVDGGNSKTDVLLASADGTVLAYVRGPGSNHQLLGIEPAVSSIGDTLAAALEIAGLDAADPPHAGVGAYCLAGVDFPIDEERIDAALEKRSWTTERIVANDTFAVWLSGSDEPWGVGVVCGTGLNCAGRGPDGTTVRFPSLGELSGDFTPGGAWLGVRGLGLALRADDGRGAPTALRDAVAEHFGLADPMEVLQGVYSGAIPYGRLFELARVVLSAAGDGDAVANAAVGELADEVGAMAGAAISRLGVADLATPVVLGGGIFDAGNSAFTQRVTDHVRARCPAAVVSVLDTAPVVGAALFGLDESASENVSGSGARREIRARLRRGLQGRVDVGAASG